jgi:hypothetical protein
MAKVQLFESSDFTIVVRDKNGKSKTINISIDDIWRFGLSRGSVSVNSLEYNKESFDMKKAFIAAVLAVAMAASGSGCSIIQASPKITEVSGVELVNVAASRGATLAQGAKAYYDCIKQELYIAKVGRENIRPDDEILKSCGRTPDHSAKYGIDSYSNLVDPYKR